jgi:zinc transporter 7
MALLRTAFVSLLLTLLLVLLLPGASIAERHVHGHHSHSHNHGHGHSHGHGHGHQHAHDHGHSHHGHKKAHSHKAHTAAATTATAAATASPKKSESPAPAAAASSPQHERQQPHFSDLASSASVPPAAEQHEAFAQLTLVAHFALVLILLANAVPALLLRVIPSDSASVFRSAIRAVSTLVSLVASVVLALVFWQQLDSSGSLPAHWLHAEVAAASWARIAAALDAFVAGVAPWPVWAGALGATVAVSVIPLPLLLVLRVRAGGRAIRVLLAFSVGSLLGDVFLHLLPHAISPHEHHHGADEAHADHGHGHGHGDAHDDGAALRVGLLVLAGMLVFFVLEKLLRVCLRDGGSGGGHSHSHSHSHSHAASAASDASAQNADAEASSALAARQFGTRVLHSIADASHNFTDGMFLAASFLAAHRAHISAAGADSSSSTAAAAGAAAAAAGTASFFTWRALAAPLTDTLAVLVHEIPHEIGDYALHVQSGASRCSAIGVQLLTALGALCGAVAVLLLDAVPQFQGCERVVIPLTAGGFVYVSLVNILPTLLADLEPPCAAAAGSVVTKADAAATAATAASASSAAPLSARAIVAQTLVECAAMGAGVALMYVIALNE